MEIINEQNNKIEYNFGLLNIGNTCYANSAFQLLFTIDELRKYILDDNNWEEQLKEICIKKGISKDEDIVSLIKQYFIIILYKFLTIPGDVKNPTCLFSLFKYKNPNSNFNIREQNDSHEFLNILIDNLEEEFYKLKNIIPLETEIKKSEYSSILSDLLNIQYDIKLTNKSTLYNIPEDLWYTTYETVKLQDANLKCTSYENIEVVPVTQDDFSRIIKNPFRKPSANRVLRLDVDGKVELVSDYNIQSYTVRYIKRLEPIILDDLPNGLTIKGESKETNCKLNPALHDAILARAVKLAKASMGLLESGR